MLKQIRIKKQELWDPVNEEFVYIDEQVLTFNHCLVSLHKWEQKYKKPFAKSEKTREEMLDYIRIMCITKKVNPTVFNYLPEEAIRELNDYINDPMTATTFSKEDKAPNRETVTAELIYYWMIKLNIPVEFQYWHFNSLMTLIRVCSIKEQPPKKMGRRQLLSRNRALNEQRLRSMNTTG